MHRELGKDGEYDFWQHFRLNEELLKGLHTDTMHALYQMFVFTTETIQDTPVCRARLVKVFDGIYSAQKFNLDKKNPEAYRFIAGQISVNCEDVLFIDDQQVNIDAAKEAGMQTVLFTDNALLLKELGELRG